MSKSLDPVSRVKAVGKLASENLTDEQIASRLNMRKCNVYRDRLRFSMPTVFEEWKKQHSRKVQSVVRINQINLTRLYSAFVKDGKVEGKNFKATWSELTHEPSKPEPREAIIERIKKNFDALARDIEKLS